jgi:hypothetical protein
MNPSGDKADHNEIARPVAADSLYQLPPESNSNGGREVYMVGQGEPKPKKPLKRSSEKPRKISLVRLGWPKR